MAISKKAMLQAKVARLNAKLGRPVEPYTRDANGNVRGNEGHIHLDHNATYGGYILRIIHESTGESNFGISRRISAKEMEIHLEGIFAGLELTTKQ